MDGQGNQTRTSLLAGRLYQRCDKAPGRRERAGEEAAFGLLAVQRTNIRFDVTISSFFFSSLFFVDLIQLQKKNIL